MNKFCSISLFIGLSVVLINSKAIGLQHSFANAQETMKDISNVCGQLNGRAVSNKTFKNNSKKDSVSSNTAESNAKAKSDTAQTSFWWAAEQFDPFNGRLVQNWLAYPQLQQINLVVNWQLWTLLDYFGRYRFVNQFGTVARKYGYSLNIFDRDDRCLATYQYNPISNPPKWELKLEKLGRDSLPIESPKKS